MITNRTNNNTSTDVQNQKFYLKQESNDVDLAHINLKDLSNKREIGSVGFWSVSSCKPGFGIQQLRDNNLDTYWQSDGNLPHTISIQFKSKVLISHIYFFCNYTQDESYTPYEISLYIGSNYNDITKVYSTQLEDPNGWQEIDLTTTTDESIDTCGHFVQFVIEGNHQSGKDSHLRQFKIFTTPVDFIPTDYQDELISGPWQQQNSRASEDPMRKYTVLK